MSVTIHLTGVAAPDRMLTHEEFTSLILEAAQDKENTLPIWIASGVMTTRYEGDLDEQAHELVSRYDYDDAAMTVWYEGSDLADIETALKRMPYGREDILVDFQIYPTFYALTEPRTIAFTSAYDDSVEYMTAAHLCNMGHQKREAPIPTQFSSYKLLRKYYGVVQLAYEYR